MQGSTPPRSDRRVVGGAYVLDGLPPPLVVVAVRGRLVPSLSAALRRSLRFEDGGRAPVEVGADGGSACVDGPASASSSAGGTGLAGSFDGVGCKGAETKVSGAGVVGSGVTAALRFNLALRWADQRPCMDRLSALEPCLSVLRS